MRRLLLSFLLLLAASKTAAQEADVQVLAERLRVRAHTEAAEVEQWARRSGLPRHVTTGDRRLSIVAMRRGLPVYLTTLNAEASALTRTDLLHPGGSLGLELTGAGMTLGIWDAGAVDAEHRELAGRVNRIDGANTSNHATHVAGTLAASGLLEEARGMAYEATLHSYDWEADLAEMAEEARAGLLVSNHSYSMVAGWMYADIEGDGADWYWFGDTRISEDEDYLFGRYDHEAAAIDEVAHAHPFLLPVVAAGNDRNDDGPTDGTYRLLTRDGFVTREVDDGRPGPDGGADGFDTVSGAAVAKNVLTVGSIGTDPSGEIRPSPFSSFGPVDDGRVKPDLVGVGEELFSSFSGANSYGRLSGTSMATPTVAGSLLLLQQHYRNWFDRPLRAASLRALALHTVRDLGMPGPDYRTGWGLLDAAAAVTQLDRMREDPLALAEYSLQRDAVHTEIVFVEEPGPVRITVAWSDPASSRRPPDEAGLDDRRSHLVHDLDLRIEHQESGTVARPYVLDPRQPHRAATTGDNVADTVEQIYLATAEPGFYTITVAHKGELEAAAQPFTLLVTGAREATRPLVVDAFELDPEEDRVQLTWTTQLENSEATFTVERAALRGPEEVLDESLLSFVVIDSFSSMQMPDGHTYTYDHLQVLAGHYRYRLRVSTDRYDEIVASETVFVVPPRRQAVVSAYPQPARDRLSLVLDVPTSEETTVEVYDVTGRRVARRNAGRLRAGRHHLNLDTSAWAPGVYIARVVSDDATSTHPFVVAR